MDDKEKSQKFELLDIVFTPSSPITSKDLFWGRLDEITKVMHGIRDRGQHLILYGDRGVGKTSLANIINEQLDILKAKITCNRTENFKDIWTKIFKRIAFVAKTSGIGFTAIDKTENVQLGLFLPKDHEVDSNDILEVLEKLDNEILFIFDEFDSVKDNETRKKFADTIKALSDNAPKVTILLVGIADNVGELIGFHPSNERCIKQIKLESMSDEELSEIVVNGLKRLEMTIDPLVQRKIIEFSHGFPHYTHLLSKYSARSAIYTGLTKISKIHFDEAVDDSIENVHGSIQDTYHKAVMSSKKETMYKDVVRACALCPVDDRGTFRTADLAQILTGIMEKHIRLQAFTYHLGKLCKEERGEVLQKVGSRYKFKNPMLKAFVQLIEYQNTRVV